MKQDAPRRWHSRRGIWVIAGVLGAVSFALAPTIASSSPPDRSLDALLRKRLAAEGFTGRIESTLTARLGRPLDRRLADTGRMLWFDTITGLNDDNACAGCHSPATGFGDTQSIAIGIDSNGIVGPDRTGPRNQRRAPMVLNTAFYPSLMLNNRFSSLLRNLALQPTFMHDGAFTSLEAAVRHHLNVVVSALTYDPAAQRLDADLTGPIAPVEPMLTRVDPLLLTPTRLSRQQLDSLVAFLRNGLLDPRAKPERLRHLAPDRLPSGRRALVFQFQP